MLHPGPRPAGLSPPCSTPSLCVGPQVPRTQQPHPPRGLLHSGKGMEVIHSGYYDCPFPGRGCAWEVPAACRGRPRPGRTFRPLWTRRPDRRRKKEVWRVAGAALHLLWPRAPRRARAPRPPRSLLQLNFLFAAADPGSLPGPGSRRRPCVSRRHPPARPALTPRAPPPAWEPRGPAARHQGALRGRRGGREGSPSRPWAGEPARRGAAGRRFRFHPFLAELPPGPEPLAEGVTWGEFNATLSPRCDSAPREAGPFRVLLLAAAGSPHLAVRRPPARILNGWEWEGLERAPVWGGASSLPAPPVTAR